MKPIIAVAALCGLGAVLAAGAAVGETQSRPPYAKAGECYARPVKPAVYGTETRQVVDTEAWTETRPVAAVTKLIERQVVVRPEKIERTWHEAVYRDEVRWVTRPGPRQVVQEAPRYETRQEKVLIEAGRYEWQRSFAPIAQTYGAPGYNQTLVYATGEVYCRVWIEPRYKLIEKTVMVSAGRSYEVEGPAIKEKVVDHVLVSEGGWTERREAAEYRTDRETVVIEPARTETIPHPARYRTVTNQVLITGEREEWVKIPCAKPAAAPVYGERG